MLKKFCFRPFLPVLIVLLSLPPGLFAQTARVLDEVLESPRVTSGQASLFILASDGKISEGATEEEALSFARKEGWISGKARLDSPTSLGEVSLLLMRTLDIPGGLFYSLFHSPRHACRSLVNRGIIRGRSDPSQGLSGEQFLQILGSALSYSGRGESEGQSISMGDEEPPEEAGAEEAAQEVAKKYELPPEKELDSEGKQKALEIASRYNVSLETAQAIVSVQEQLAAAGLSARDPVRTPEGLEITINLPVGFITNTANFIQGEQRKILLIARGIRRMPGKVIITGHTADQNLPDLEMILSKERAQAVADVLIEAGIRKKSDFVIVGRGAAEKVADNSSPEGREKNRRVEIKILLPTGAPTGAPTGEQAGRP